MLPQPWLLDGGTSYRYYAEFRPLPRHAVLPSNGLCCHLDTPTASSCSGDTLAGESEASGKAVEVVSTSLTLGVERFLPRAASRLYYALCQK